MDPFPQLIASHFRVFRQGSLQGTPCQQSAFAPRGSQTSFDQFEHLIRRETKRLLQGRSFHALSEQRRRRLADDAAITVETHSADRLPRVELHLDLDSIATERVLEFEAEIRGFEMAAVGR